MVREHKGGARPDTLVHLYVNDIDAVSEELQIPVDEEGLAGRECDIVDPNGTGSGSLPGAPDVGSSERSRGSRLSRQITDPQGQVVDERKRHVPNAAG